MKENEKGKRGIERERKTREGERLENIIRKKIRDVHVRKKQ